MKMKPSEQTVRFEPNHKRHPINWAIRKHLRVKVSLMLLGTSFLDILSNQPFTRNLPVFLSNQTLPVLAQESTSNSLPKKPKGPLQEKIKNIVIIMQENRSFDHYFGTFPGADGIPMRGGVPSVCAPDPRSKLCIKPFHDPEDISWGGPHGSRDSIVNINNGKMDGFIIQAQDDSQLDPISVMGYKTEKDIPNYWAYAKNFVLQDRMFEPIASWSEPAHLFMVSAWSASCQPHKPLTCKSEIDDPENFAWTDITYLLHKNKVSWKYYLGSRINLFGAPRSATSSINNANSWQEEPQCKRGQSCPELQRKAPPSIQINPSIWNPLPGFDTVINSKSRGNIQNINDFYEDAQNGTLPAVSWIIPNGPNSEHPPNSTRAGQAHVTSVINAIMQGPQWKNSAIFLSWDDWGGYYDHVVPPKVDALGYGIRVPGLVISPYAKKGYIDHQTLSFDAYLKFIEDVFLDGQRLNPATMGRPDSRPVVRENVRILGDLTKSFDFNQPPRPPLILPVDPYP